MNTDAYQIVGKRLFVKELKVCFVPQEQVVDDFQSANAQNLMHFILG